MVQEHHRIVYGVFTLKYLWSPWRMEYIKSNNQEEECVFCNSLEQSDCSENLIVHRGNRAFVILNRYPYTSGHLMVLPFNHQSSLDSLDPETRSEMMELSNQAVCVLKSVYKAQGFNLGINIGDAGGAGIAEHIHLHIVPRWKGDTNFMSSLGETRVIPESLQDTYRQIKDVWDKTQPE